MAMSHSNLPDLPDDWVMTEQQLRAVVSGWSPRLYELALQLERLPYRQDPEGRRGFVHALHRLRNDLSAVAALCTVADEWTVRPRYQEVLDVADAAVEIRWELRK